MLGATLEACGWALLLTPLSFTSPRALLCPLVLLRVPLYLLMALAPRRDQVLRITASNEKQIALLRALGEREDLQVSHASAPRASPEL